MIYYINLNYIHLIQCVQFLKIFIPYSYSIILGYNISSDYTICYLFNEYLWVLWVIMVRYD